MSLLRYLAIGFVFGLLAFLANEGITRIKYGIDQSISQNR